MIIRHKQRGIALVALLAIVALGATYWIYAALNANTASAAVERSKRDSEVLRQAKAALIGQIALQAANASEPNPGRLPCPEKSADAGTANEGLPDTASAGNPFGYCGTGATVVVGRLPWKALGIDKLQDTATEPLWYAVAPGWITAGPNTIINSDTPALGGLASTAGDNDVIAVIFAPGQALSGQARQPVDGVAVPAVANYLDLQNSTLGVLNLFAKTGPEGTFNDHVIILTRAELMPEIEAAVADRLHKQIAPQMNAAYSSAPWTVAPTLPFAAGFGDPSTASYKGTTATTQGLLPVTYSDTGPCSPGPCIPASCNPAGNPRCDPAFLVWRTSATVTRTGGTTPAGSPTCAISGPPARLDCTVEASAPLASGITWMDFDMSVTADNVGKALRRLNDTVPMTGNVDTLSIRSPYGYSVSAAALNTDSSGTVTFGSRFASGSGTPLAFLGAVDCALSGLYCVRYTISIPLAIFSDHAVVDASDATLGWFVRNRWHELSYYAIASGMAPSQPAASRGCTTGTDCLTANYLSTTAYAGNSVKGLVVIGGRQLPAQTRPSATVTDYFEDSNASLTGTYAARAPALVFNRTFNDRVVVIDHN